LFVRYQSDSGVDFYERVANLEVLTPKNYGSTNLLWNRIPQYYRELDTRIGDTVDPASSLATVEYGSLPVGNVVGPLYKFLSIFGFEMDRVRTIIDYLMVSRDPAEANTEVLDAVASTMGVGYSSSSLSSERLRALLDDIGYIRRAKGTLEGTESYGRAIAASDVEVDQVTRSLKFFAQRVNYFTDPLDATGQVTSRPAHEVEVERLRYSRGTYDASTYVSGTPATYPQPFYGEEYLPGMYWTAASAGTVEGITADVGDYIVYYEKNGVGKFGVSGYAFNADNYSSYTTYSVASGTEYVPNGSGASVGVNHVMFHIDCPVPVQAADRLAFSVHSTLGTSALKYARLVDSSGNVIGESAALTKAQDSPAIEIVANDNLAGDWTIGFIEFVVDLESVSTYSLKYLLAERNRLGNYFDGSFVNGGWISNPAGTSRTGDYNWSSEGENTGNPFDSISVYTEDYQRTRAVLGNTFLGLLPITQADYYTVTSYNAIPGMDAIDAYLTGP
jgi:hypothetical protein